MSDPGYWRIADGTLIAQSELTTEQLDYAIAYLTTNIAKGAYTIRHVCKPSLRDDEYCIQCAANKILLDNAEIKLAELQAEKASRV